MTNLSNELALAIGLALRGRVRLLLAIVLAAAVAACGSTSTTTTALGPTPVKCAVSVTASPSAMDAAGGAGSVAVATQAECTWTASADANWISGLSPTSGQGSGSVAFQAAPNPNGTSRQGSVTVNGLQAMVSQAAAPCGFSLDKSSIDLSAAGATVTVTVSAPNGCSWQASSTSAWISVLAGNSGNGGGTVTVRVASNPGSERTGSVVIGGQTVTVSQAGVENSSCEYSIEPTAVSVPAAGGTRTAVVTARAGCAWNATKTATWVTITSGASGQGGGSVTFSVAANTGSARTAALSIAGETLSISQAGNCSVSITPMSNSVGASGGTGTIAVSSPAGCSWTASSTVSWLTIASGANGNGNGNVTYSVAANTNAARVGSLSIGNETFTVNQAAATSCSFSIDPTNQSFGAAGGTGTPISVSTTSGCAWTASSNAPWISITAGSSGTGAGSVTFNVVANTGGARTGTLGIAGKTFTVTQAASCAYSINPTSKSVGAGGGDTTIAVSTSAGCGWTAAANVSWIAVTSGASGSGNGSVKFTVPANTGPARSGTLTVAGQTFTVTQAGNCDYSISPSKMSPSAVGGVGTSSVSAPAGCTWTATSNATWITVLTGASGSGNGTVTFLVAPNTEGRKRNGTLTIAGRTFTVEQDDH